MQDTIAVVFDFDDTLAPDSTSGLLDTLGIDVPAFWAGKVEPLIQSGWDPVPAYLFRMIEWSQQHPDQTITRDTLRQWGRRLRPYPGVAALFKRLRKEARAVDPEVSVEFYLISSGIEEVLRSTRIAAEFTDIWACEFHYAEDSGGIAFPRRVVSFTDKTRYLFHIAKGVLGDEARRDPFAVNRKVPGNRLRIPFQQMVYVGDGYTDIPCFSLIRSNEGIAFGVYDREDRKRWGRAWGFVEDGRVSNLLPADYGRHSALTSNLCMAVESLAQKLALRRRTYQG
jgi:phosphoglycolate phosphatase-like HAD superfamily hydrolase